MSFESDSKCTKREIVTTYASSAGVLRNTISLTFLSVMLTPAMKAKPGIIRNKVAMVARTTFIYCFSSLDAKWAP